jgi:hypothetical protein
MITGIFPVRFFVVNIIESVFQRNYRIKVLKSGCATITNFIYNFKGITKAFGRHSEG